MSMLMLYRLLLYLALPGVVARLAWRGMHNRRYRERLGQRFGRLPIRPRENGIWIHAVSVGEVNAAEPLIRRLMQRCPEREIIVTTMTPTGSDRVIGMFADRVRHCYLPYDYPGAVRRFLDCTRPAMAVIMETEIWPNFIHRCHRLRIPVAYVNVRLSQRSQRGYQKLGGLIRPTLRKVTLFAVQTQPDAARLIALGARESALQVTGNLKFDLSLPANVTELAAALRRQLGWVRPVWMAGSTHDGEELQILHVFAQLRKSIPSLLLLLAPRHPERCDAIYRLCRRQGYRTRRRSVYRAALSDDVEIYLVDTMGELPLLIAASDFAFIGGSLTSTGGHNLLEACMVGIPVVFGPSMYNFAEIAELVLQHEAGVQVQNASELAEVGARWAVDAALRERYGAAGKLLVQQNQGATEKVDRLLGRILADRPA